VTLAVCATPIGNLDDVTLRVLAELREADVVLCEDTRHTARLLDRHGIRARALLSYHRHNEAARQGEVLERLRGGERVALVSDAGLPGINDPGVRLVSAVRDAGLEVTVLPGASAVTSAVVASGFPAERYQFLGYLPRRAALDALWAELESWPHVAVAFESPRRLAASLASLAAAAPERPVAVCRELTKRFEEVVRGPAREVAARFAGETKGEIVVVLGPVPARREADDDAVAAVAELVEAGVPRRQAAEIVERLTGASARSLYKRSL
jgi:16S rRNA (cytidine1402-2'-O)-methyltransferase